MSKINPLILAIKPGYIFSEIAARRTAYRKSHPDCDLINLGIGDVSEPLTATVVDALKNAADEMGKKIRGYGPELGYNFLREKIAHTLFAGCAIEASEIFISEGIATDLSSIRDLFSQACTIAICDPTYPAYLNTSMMRVPESQIIRLPLLETNGFVPQLPKEHADLIYLCSPSNPTGNALTRAQLQGFVDYARANKSLIIFDGAYEPFITSKDVPHSIFELPGADEVAIELRSFSKGAGFTGLRCGYLTIPHKVRLWDGQTPHLLNPLFARTQESKTNGVSYPIQRAAEAALSAEGLHETSAQIARYREASALLKTGLTALGYKAFGGIDSPYIWVKTPEGLSSWEFFDQLLNTHQMICLPGVGFGSCGEGFVRFSGFTERSIIEKALTRLTKKECTYA